MESILNEFGILSLHFRGLSDGNIEGRVREFVSPLRLELVTVATASFLCRLKQ